MLKHVLIAAVSAAVLAPVSSAIAQSTRGDLLYRMTLMRAAPGRLLDLVSEIKTSIDSIRGSTTARADRRPLILRHSQGDQWDIMILAPIGSYAEHFGRSSAISPAASPELIAWQEDEFVRGPDLWALDGFTTANLYHVEMFVALAEKRSELIKEREMENAYLLGVGRPANAIFVREIGAAWDALTVGAYRNWKHYAERDDIAPDKVAAAAKAAGFEGDDRIGPYLRSLINTHHDTLATPIR